MLKGYIRLVVGNDNLGRIRGIGNGIMLDYIIYKKFLYRKGNNR